MAFSEAAPRLVLHELGVVVDRGEAFGRIAFSCAEEDVPRAAVPHMVPPAVPVSIERPRPMNTPSLQTFMF